MTVEQEAQIVYEALYTRLRHIGTLKETMAEDIREVIADLAQKAGLKELVTQGYGGFKLQRSNSLMRKPLVKRIYAFEEMFYEVGADEAVDIGWTLEKGWR